MVRKQISSVVDRFWDNLTAKGIDPKAIYVFGSQSTGDHHHRSDIDIMVVLPGPMPWEDERKSRGLWIAYNTDPRIEAWFIGEDDFRDLDTPLVSLVRDQGELMRAA